MRNGVVKVRINYQANSVVYHFNVLFAHSICVNKTNRQTSISVIFCVLFHGILQICKGQFFPSYFRLTLQVYAQFAQFKVLYNLQQSLVMISTLIKYSFHLISFCTSNHIVQIRLVRVQNTKNSIGCEG